MTKMIDLTGKVFGQWEVLSFSHRVGQSKYWLCRCSCGKEKPVTACSLNRGTSVSCGCFRSIETKKRLKKYTFDFVKKTIEEHGYILLSGHFDSVDQKLDVICDNGHLYHPRFSSILNNTWCSVCAKKARFSYEFVVQTIEARGGKLITDCYKNSKQRLEIICENGHSWDTCFDAIRRGHWCSFCASKKSNIEECKKLASERGGDCLSTEYINNKTKLEWECELGHRWFATRSGVLKGTWCPECSEPKTQRMLTDILREILPEYTVYSDFREFTWLSTESGRKQEIDIFIPELKLGIEYDGEQHFKPVCYGGISLDRAEKNLEIVRNRDLNKNIKISEHKDDVNFFIRFNYTEKDLFSKEYIESKLKELGIL